MTLGPFERGGEELRLPGLQLPSSGSRCYALVQVHAAGAAPAFFLLARAPGEDVPPLELHAARIDLPTCLAADERSVLLGLLRKLAESLSPRWVDEQRGQTVRVWEISEAESIAEIEQLLGQTRVRPWLGSPKGWVAVAPLSDPALELLPIHRGLRGVAHFHEDTFLTVLRAYMHIEPLADSLDGPAGLAAALDALQQAGKDRHAFLLVLPNARGLLLKVRQGLDLSHLRSSPTNPSVRSLDLALLETLVFGATLGVPGPYERHPHVVSEVDAASLVREVGSTFQAGFLLNPPPRWEIRAVMEAGAQLPADTAVLAPALPAALFSQ